MTTPVSRLLAPAATPSGSRSPMLAGWNGWLLTGCRVAAGRVGRLAVAVHRRSGQRPDRGVAVPHSGLPDGDATAVTGRCASCRRSRSRPVICEEQFDAAPPAAPTRRRCPWRLRGAGCEGESHCRGLCFRHERGLAPRR